MVSRREVRTLAMQVLYQVDMRGLEDAAQIRLGMDEAPGNDDEHELAYNLALAAWDEREQADGHCTQLAPDWPTHRQPPVDRAILRLAHHEMASGHAPMKVAINEAVELAKKFGAENSPSFINGVLDKLGRQLSGEPDEPVETAE